MHPPSKLEFLSYIFFKASQVTLYLFNCDNPEPNLWKKVGMSILHSLGT